MIFFFFFVKPLPLPLLIRFVGGLAATYIKCITSCTTKWSQLWPQIQSVVTKDHLFGYTYSQAHKQTHGYDCCTDQHAAWSPSSLYAMMFCPLAQDGYVCVYLCIMTCVWLSAYCEGTSNCSQATFCSCVPSFSVSFFKLTFSDIFLKNGRATYRAWWSCRQLEFLFVYWFLKAWSPRQSRTWVCPARGILETSIMCGQTWAL